MTYSMLSITSNPFWKRSLKAKNLQPSGSKCSLFRVDSFSERSKTILIVLSLKVYQFPIIEAIRGKINGP